MYIHQQKKYKKVLYRVIELFVTKKHEFIILSYHRMKKKQRCVLQKPCAYMFSSVGFSMKQQIDPVNLTHSPGTNTDIVIIPAFSRHFKTHSAATARLTLMGQSKFSWKPSLV